MPSCMLDKQYIYSLLVESAENVLLEARKKHHKHKVCSNKPVNFIDTILISLLVTNEGNKITQRYKNKCNYL